MENEAEIRDVLVDCTPPALVGAKDVPTITIPLWAFDRVHDALRRLLAGGERTATIEDALPLFNELRRGAIPEEPVA